MNESKEELLELQKKADRMGKISVISLLGVFVCSGIVAANGGIEEKNLNIYFFSLIVGYIWLISLIIWIVRTRKISKLKKMSVNPAEKQHEYKKQQNVSSNAAKYYAPQKSSNYYKGNDVKKQQAGCLVITLLAILWIPFGAIFKLVGKYSKK